MLLSISTEREQQRIGSQELMGGSMENENASRLKFQNWRHWFVQGLFAKNHSRCWIFWAKSSADVLEFSGLSCKTCWIFYGFAGSSAIWRCRMSRVFMQWPCKASWIFFLFPTWWCKKLRWWISWSFVCRALLIIGHLTRCQHFSELADDCYLKALNNLWCVPRQRNWIFWVLRKSLEVGGSGLFVDSYFKMSCVITWERVRAICATLWHSIHAWPWVAQGSEVQKR